MADDPVSLDLEQLRGWIGRQEQATDAITPRLEASLRAVFDRPSSEPVPGEAATPSIHWCLTPPVARMSDLGEDGHPRRGGFLPPVPLPRRMWAGGAFVMRDPLRVGDAVTRTSQIEDVNVKTGRTGTLCFVTVRHVFSTERGPALEERQDIVYRAQAAASPAAKAEPAPPQAERRRLVPCDPVLLFRYSALTFNGHRIHYDRDYATRQEGYPDIVVHGPLQAAMLLHLAAEIRGEEPQNFAFRGVSPLFPTGSFAVNAAADGAALRLWTSDGTGRVAMEATARWE